MDDDLARLRPLLAQVADAKRIRVAARPGSLAEQSFTRSWARLVAGDEPGAVAAAEVAGALAEVRLAGVDQEVLEAGGLSADEAVAVLGRAYDEVAGPVPDAARWRAALGTRPASRAWTAPGAVPGFVRSLAVQPRAGATAPGERRIVVEPPESHGDHCRTVAVYGALLAPLHGADPVDAWLLGLAHHLHNAALPDAGFAGDVLLGDHRHRVEERFTEEALAQLPAALRERVRPLLALRAGVEHPASRAFHAADVLDRVLQVHHHARAAAFTAEQALDDLDLVHVGPEQGLQLQVLDAAGLR